MADDWHPLRELADQVRKIGHAHPAMTQGQATLTEAAAHLETMAGFHEAIAREDALKAENARLLRAIHLLEGSGRTIPSSGAVMTETRTAEEINRESIARRRAKERQEHEAALATAQETGRRAGLEEAARLLEGYVASFEAERNDAKQDPRDAEAAAFWDDYRRFSINILRDIRALAEQPVTATGGEGWRPTHRHWKGGLYRVLGKVTIEATMTPAVLYEAKDGRRWVRPKDDFEAMVESGWVRVTTDANGTEREPHMVPRFAPLQEPPA